MSDQELSTRQCPFCKEEVKAEAVRCKHCQATILPEKPTHQGVCPFCKEDINPQAIRCKHCQANLAPVALEAPGSSTRGFPSRLQISASVPRLFRQMRDDDNCEGCPPVIMNGSTQWLLESCDRDTCSYIHFVDLPEGAYA